ncbi:MAG: AmmeMemoRadiSam system protein B [Syntrophaceae bacterium]|nr:AmmeMemoRadiSam system protein B [Syntrophaceae bacterium]
MSAASRRDDVRPPVVGGQFYAKSETALRGSVVAFLASARPAVTKAPLAIVVPHAGYIYSGQICADGWNQARGREIETVVLLGTNHTTPEFRKISLYGGGGFQTPLGIAATDREVTAYLAASPDCLFEDKPHIREHSLEVQVPFAQVLFPKAKIVAAIVGEADLGLCTRLGNILAKNLAGRKALIVASSDLSHYPPAEVAEEVDKKVLAAVASLDPARFQEVIQEQERCQFPGLHTCACGEATIMAAMAAAKALGATGGRVVSYAHSGDIPIGEQNRVVGYGAVVFAGDLPPATEAVPEKPAASGGTLTKADQQGLLALARNTITLFLTTQTVPLPRDFSPAVRELHGVFVTLKKRGDLRGCIGRMIPDRPLAALVGAIALQSAFEDPRFPAVSFSEMPELQIEISVLSPMQPVSGPEAIVVGRDGVLLQKGSHSAVFLPQVAPEQGWGREEMLNHLSMKAGLSASAWQAGARFSIFQSQVFGEEEPTRR